MTDRVEEAMNDVWAWKRQAEEATRGMTAAQLIEFYRLKADDAERRLGLHLKVRNAADAARPRRS